MTPLAQKAVELAREGCKRNGLEPTPGAIIAVLAEGYVQAEGAAEAASRGFTRRDRGYDLEEQKYPNAGIARWVKKAPGKPAPAKGEP